MGKCACILTKDKATQFFNPFQYGVACPAGTEKKLYKGSGKLLRTTGIMAILPS